MPAPLSGNAGGCSLVVRFARPAKATFASHPFMAARFRAASPCRRTGVGYFGSALFDLSEFQIDGHGAPDDRNFHLEPRPLLVHFLNETVERRERPVRNA